MSGRERTRKTPAQTAGRNPAGAEGRLTSSSASPRAGGARPHLSPAAFVAAGGGREPPVRAGARGGPTPTSQRCFSVQRVASFSPSERGARGRKRQWGAETPTFLYVGVDDTRLGSKVVIAFTVFYETEFSVPEPKENSAVYGYSEAERTVYKYLKRISVFREYLIVNRRELTAKRVAKFIVQCLQRIKYLLREHYVIVQCCNLGLDYKELQSEIISEIQRVCREQGSMWLSEKVFSVKVSRPGEVQKYQKFAAYFARARALRGRL